MKNYEVFLKNSRSEKAIKIAEFDTKLSRTNFNEELGLYLSFSIDKVKFLRAIKHIPGAKYFARIDE